MFTVFSDYYYMGEALKEAQKAADMGEVPIGAVVVLGGRIIARAHNLVEHLQDVTAHAEMLAITAAAQYLNSKYLHECTLYVTLEPCPMCAGALSWTQIPHIVYGTADPKRGFYRFGNSMLHPKTQVSSDIRPDECAELLRQFFATKR